MFPFRGTGFACWRGIPSGVPQLLCGVLRPRVLDQVGLGQQGHLPHAYQDEVLTGYLVCHDSTVASCDITLVSL